MLRIFAAGIFGDIFVDEFIISVVIFVIVFIFFSLDIIFSQILLATDNEWYGLLLTICLKFFFIALLFFVDLDLLLPSVGMINSIICISQLGERLAFRSTIEGLTFAFTLDVFVLLHATQCLIYHLDIHSCHWMINCDQFCIFRFDQLLRGSTASMPAVSSLLGPLLMLSSALYIKTDRQLLISFLLYRIDVLDVHFVALGDFLGRQGRLISLRLDSRVDLR